ncbi:MAG: hypothetical protein CM15mP66_06260 [Pseudomonadota bacterium]|nr:MAG: hypothetical protein CM15mP66_06260 [Pseudomonadota bacterium]
MVGMTRAHIADPHIVRKIIEKRRMKSDPVSVPPIAWIDLRRHEALCIHNPATGREKQCLK